MIRINLLPYRAARKKENIRFQVNVFLGSVVLVALLVWLFNSHLSGRIGKLNTEIANTRAQVAKYKSQMDEIALIKKKLDILERKIKVIRSLEADRKAPVQNLDSYYNLLVENRMWYDKIEEKQTNINISGIALDNQTVADYMTRIENSDRFQNVQLASVKQHKIQGKEMKLKKFEVQFKRKPAEKAATGGKK